MKKLIIKLDKFILDQLTSYIKKWIEKKEYKKNKIDFQISLEWIELYVVLIVGIAIPVLLYIISGQTLMGTLHFFFWIIVVFIDVKYILFLLKDVKPFHDRMFSLRKNPIYYDMEKSILAELFISGRRQRIITNGFLILITGSVIFLVILSSLVSHWLMGPSTFVALYLLFNSFYGIIRRYITYVFDFDEPQEKKKVVKQSLTEIVLKTWQQFIGGFNPQPQI